MSPLIKTLQPPAPVVGSAAGPVAKGPALTVLVPAAVETVRGGSEANLRLVLHRTDCLTDSVASDSGERAKEDGWQDYTGRKPVG